jgi:hypothetical protein
MLSSPRLQEPSLFQLVKALLSIVTTSDGPNSNSLLPYFVYGTGNYNLEMGFLEYMVCREKSIILEVKQQLAAAVISTHRYYRYKFFKDNCSWFWKQKGHIQYIFHLTFTCPGCCQ